MLKPLLIAFAVLLFIPNLINKDINEYLPYDHKEKFDASLSHLNSIDKLDQYIDKVAAEKNAKPHSIEYAVIVEDVIARRFYHGFSHQSLSENFIAAVSEKTIGYGLSCKVKPEEIMQHENAACSQQSMVMMEIFKRKNINYRSVGFPHHFAMEAFVDDHWYYMDANMEPNISMAERKEESWKCCADKLKQYYDKDRFRDLDFKFGNGQTTTLGVINEQPAKNAKIFQTATGYASKLLWCLPLLILAYRRRKSFSKIKAPVIRLYPQEPSPLFSV